MIKLIGAMGIMLACGGCGLAMGHDLQRQERDLRLLHDKLAYIYRELQYRATPLPALLDQAAGEERDPLSALLRKMAQLLTMQQLTDGRHCMELALKDYPKFSDEIVRLLLLFGSCLGAFDLRGQLSHLESVMEECKRSIDILTQSKQMRMRNFRTLGFCVGGVLALLLF